MKKSSAILLPVFLLSGCAALQGPFMSSGGAQAAGPGQAAYYYRNGDCEVRITSAREVTGAAISIDPECGVSVSTDIAPSMELQMQSMSMLEALIKRLISQ